MQPRPCQCLVTPGRDAAAAPLLGMLLPFWGCCSVPAAPRTPAQPQLRLPRRPWLLSSGKGFLGAGQSGFRTMSSTSPRRLYCAACPGAAPALPAPPQPPAGSLQQGWDRSLVPPCPGPEALPPGTLGASRQSQAGACRGSPRGMQTPRLSSHRRGEGLPVSGAEWRGEQRVWMKMGIKRGFAACAVPGQSNRHRSPELSIWYLSPALKLN